MTADQREQALAAVEREEGQPLAPAVDVWEQLHSAMVDTEDEEAGVRAFDEATAAFRKQEFPTAGAVLPADLAEIQARADAATPGPWGFDEIPETGECRVDRKVGPDDQPDFEAITSGGSTFNDAVFIAHARTDVPALVAELTAARIDLARMAHPLDAELTRIREKLAASAPADLPDKVMALLAELAERRARSTLTAEQAADLDRRLLGRTVPRETVVALRAIAARPRIQYFGDSAWTAPDGTTHYPPGAHNHLSDRPQTTTSKEN